MEESNNPMSRSVVKPHKGLHTDSSYGAQPQGTYTFALNAVEESMRGERDMLSNEESNLAGAQFTAGYIPIGKCYMSGGDTAVFLISADEASQEIGIVDKDSNYTPFLNCNNLGFRTDSQIDTTYRLRRGCERIVYFTDPNNRPRFFNFDRPTTFTDLDTGDCLPNRMLLQRTYDKIPEFTKITVLNAGGDLVPGSYNVAIQYLDENFNPTDWVVATDTINIYNDDLTLPFRQISGSINSELEYLDFEETNKAIEINVGNLDEGFLFYRLAFIEATTGTGEVSDIKLTQVIPTKKKNFLYTGTNFEEKGTLEEIAAFNDYIETAEHITQVDNTLVLGNVKGPQANFCNLQRYASKIRADVLLKEVVLTELAESNPKSPTINLESIGYQPGEIYSFGIVWLFEDGTKSPVYHIPGKNPGLDDSTVFEPGVGVYGMSTDNESASTTYVDNSTCTNTNYWAVDSEGTYLRDQLVRHHRFPLRKDINVPLFVEDLAGATTNEFTTYTLQLTITGSVLTPTDDFSESCASLSGPAVTNVIRNGSDPVVIQMAAGAVSFLENGDNVAFTGIEGTTELNFVNANAGPTYVVENIDYDNNRFTLAGTDSSAFSAFATGVGNGRMAYQTRGEAAAHIIECEVEYTVDGTTRYIVAEIDLEQYLVAEGNWYTFAADELIFYSDQFVNDDIVVTGLQQDAPAGEVEIIAFTLANEIYTNDATTIYNLDQSIEVVDEVEVTETKLIKGNIYGIKFSNIELPPVEQTNGKVVIGYDIVRNERTEEQKTILDSAVLLPTIGSGKYVSHGISGIDVPNSNTIDKRTYGFINPEFKFRGREYEDITDIVQIGSYRIDDRKHSWFREQDVLDGTSYDEDEHKGGGPSEGKGLDGWSFFMITRDCVVNFYEEKTSWDIPQAKIKSVFYLDSLDNRYLEDYSGTYIFNNSADNRTGFIHLNEAQYEAPLIGRLPYVYFRKAIEDPYATFRTLPYFPVNQTMQSGTEATIFGGDSYISPMRYSSTTFWDNRIAKRAAKTSVWKIVAGAALIVVGAILIPFTGGGSALAVGAGITLVGGGALLAASGFKKENAANAYNSAYERGLKNTVAVDNWVNGHLNYAFYGQYDTPGDDEIQWIGEVISDLWFESQVNFAIRTRMSTPEPNFLDAPGIIETGRTGLSPTRKINVKFSKSRDVYQVVDTHSPAYTVLDQHFDSKILYPDSNRLTNKAYLGHPLGEWYHINPDYQRRGKEKIYFHLPIEYDCCSKCNEDFSQRIRWSQQSFQEELLDNYQVFLPNDYRDIEGENGEITDMFTMNNQLYIHTKEALYFLPANYQEKVVGNIVSFIGTGDLFSIPERIVVDADHSSGGTIHKWSKTKTPYGILFVSGVDRKVYLFDGKSLKPLSMEGMNSYFQKHIPIGAVADYYKQDQEDFPFDDNPSNPVGTGYLTAYDDRKERFLVSKKDFSNPAFNINDSRLIYHNGEPRIFLNYQATINTREALGWRYLGIQNGEMKFERDVESVVTETRTTFIPEGNCDPGFTKIIIDGNKFCERIDKVGATFNGIGYVGPAIGNNDNTAAHGVSGFQVYDISAATFPLSSNDLINQTSGATRTPYTDVTTKAYWPPVIKEKNVWGYTTYTEASVTNITEIGNANPVVITVDDITGFSNGDIIRFAGVQGTTEINNVEFEIDNIVGNTFNILWTVNSSSANAGLPATGFVLGTATPWGSYISGGIIQKFSNKIADDSWWGFTTCLDLVTSGTYYILICADNRMRFNINGENVVNFEKDGSTYHFIYVHGFEWDFEVGLNVLAVQAYNEGDTDAMFFAEVYEVTAAEVVANNYYQVGFPQNKKIFSTGDFQALSPVKEVDFGDIVGYSCPPDYVLSTCEDVECVKIERVPVSPEVIVTNNVDITKLIIEVFTISPTAVTNDISDKSWTLSYSMKGNNWISWHSYLPSMYVTIPGKLMSWVNGNDFLWEHNQEGTFQSFYNLARPFIVELSAISQDLQTKIYEDITIHTEAKRYVPEVEEYVDENNITFNKGIFYNTRQCSGELTFKTKDADSGENYLLDQTVDVVPGTIVIDKNERDWSINNLRDIRVDYSLPIFKSNSESLQDDYYIDKVLNEDTLNTAKDWQDMESFRDKFLVIRLIFDNFEDVKLLMNYSVQTNTRTE